MHCKYKNRKQCLKYRNLPPIQKNIANTENATKYRNIPEIKKYTKFVSQIWEYTVNTEKVSKYTNVLLLQKIQPNTETYYTEMLSCQNTKQSYKRSF